MILDFLIASLAAAYAGYYWNDPTAAYYVGLNVGVFCWCACDLLRKTVSQ